MISVVIPVYNNLQYLEDCFRSVFEQDGDVEMVIVDDGSDDGSEIVCKRYSGFPRVRYIRTDRVGISCARNAGIRESSGEYISFLDSDDMLLPGTLMTLLKMLERHPKCGIAVGQYIRKEIASPGKFHEFVEDAETSIINSLYQKKYFHTSSWGKLYRREVLENTELFVEDRTYEDLEIFERLYLKAVNIVYTTKPVYFYRKNPTSFLNTISPARRDMLWATARISDYTAAHIPAAMSAACSRRFSSLFNMFNLAAVSNDEPTARECFKEICGLRGKVLTDPDVRLKNKLGALLSYFGFRLCLTIGRHT